MRTRANGASRVDIIVLSLAGKSAMLQSEFVIFVSGSTHFFSVSVSRFLRPPNAYGLGAASRSYPLPLSKLHYIICASSLPSWALHPFYPFVFTSESQNHHPLHSGASLISVAGGMWQERG